MEKTRNDNVFHHVIQVKAGDEQVLDSLGGLAKCDCLDFFLFSFPKMPIELDGEFVRDSVALNDLIKVRSHLLYEQHIHVASNGTKKDCKVDMDCVRRWMEFNKCVGK